MFYSTLLKPYLLPGFYGAVVNSWAPQANDPRKEGPVWRDLISTLSVLLR